MPEPKVDPVYGHKAPLLEADHIVPMKRIVQMPGFNRLTRSQQLEVLNLRKNFMGLSKPSNASKGARTYAEWKGHSKLGPIPEDVRAWLAQVEQRAAKALEKAISDRTGR